MKYPGSHQDFPWGERVIKVKGKAFLFMRAGAEDVSLSVKLPQSREMAVDRSAQGVDRRKLPPVAPKKIVAALGRKG